MRIMEKENSLGEILVKLRVCEDMPCIYCDENVQKPWNIYLSNVLFLMNCGTDLQQQQEL